MAKPKIFVSSTYVDLAGLREALHEFFEEMGCEPILFERGGIYFDPSKPLDESCYDTARDVDIFVLVIGGRYGSPASKNRGRSKRRRYNSVTKNEYLAAKQANIPIYTFIDTKVIHEFATWKQNPGTRGTIKFAHVDNSAIFELVEEIYQLHKNNLVIPYSSIEDITRHMKLQLAHLLQSAMKQRKQSSKPQKITVNPYKVFFFRSQKSLSFTQLAAISGIDRDLLRHLEVIDRESDALTIASFPKCSEDVVHRLEEVLECEQKLKAGRSDDFLSSYIQYYATYKGSRFIPRPVYSELYLFPTKAVVFDFDGTLTTRSDDETTWEGIWRALGYDVNECAEYHRRFTNGVITHSEWCRITRDKFRARKLTEDQLLKIADSTSLVPGARKTLTELRKRGLKLYILSGSIKSIIRHTLKNLVGLFEDIKANDLVFGPDQILTEIHGTRYDFAGKASYLTEVIKGNQLSHLEVLFVGNSCNDIWASQSGARTLCVNPKFTDPNNVEHWTYCIRKMSDLGEILKYVGDQ